MEKTTTSCHTVVPRMVSFNSVPNTERGDAITAAVYGEMEAKKQHAPTTWCGLLLSHGIPFSINNSDDEPET